MCITDALVETAVFESDEESAIAHGIVDLGINSNTPNVNCDRLYNSEALSTRLLASGYSVTGNDTVAISPQN